MSGTTSVGRVPPDFLVPADAHFRHRVDAEATEHTTNHIGGRPGGARKAALRIARRSGSVLPRGDKRGGGATAHGAHRRGTVSWSGGCTGSSARWRRSCCWRPGCEEGKLKVCACGAPGAHRRAVDAVRHPTRGGGFTLCTDPGYHYRADEKSPLSGAATQYGVPRVLIPRRSLHHMIPVQR
jgi:hypothetical protein